MVQLKWDPIPAPQDNSLQLMQMSRQSLESGINNLRAAMSEPIRQAQAESEFYQQNQAQNQQMLQNSMAQTQQGIQEDENTRAWLKLEAELGNTGFNVQAAKAYVDSIHTNAGGVLAAQIDPSLLAQFGNDTNAMRKWMMDYTQEQQQQVLAMNEKELGLIDSAWKKGNDELEEQIQGFILSGRTELVGRYRADQAKLKESYNQTRAEVEQRHAQKQADWTNGRIYSLDDINQRFAQRNPPSAVGKTAVGSSAPAVAQRYGFTAPSVIESPIDARFAHIGREGNQIVFQDKKSSKVTRLTPEDTAIVDAVGNYLDIDNMAPVLAVMFQESRGNNDAVSDSGVASWMMMEQGTFNRLKDQYGDRFIGMELSLDVDRKNKTASLLAGTLLLQQLSQNMGTEDISELYAGYNLGQDLGSKMVALWKDPIKSHQTLRQSGLYTDGRYSSIFANNTHFEPNMTLADAKVMVQSMMGQFNQEEYAAQVAATSKEADAIIAQSVRENSEVTSAEVNEATVAKVAVANEHVTTGVAGSEITQAEVDEAIKENNLEYPPLVAMTEDGAPVLNTATDVEEWISRGRHFLETHPVPKADPNITPITEFTRQDFAEIFKTKNNALIDDAYQLFMNDPGVQLMGYEGAKKFAEFVTTSGVFAKRVDKGVLAQAIQEHYGRLDASNYLNATLATHNNAAAKALDETEAAMGALKNINTSRDEMISQGRFGPADRQRFMQEYNYQLGLYNSAAAAAELALGSSQAVIEQSKNFARQAAITTAERNADMKAAKKVFGDAKKSVDNANTLIDREIGMVNRQINEVTSDAQMLDTLAEIIDTFSEKTVQEVNEGTTKKTTRAEAMQNPLYAELINLVESNSGLVSGGMVGARQAALRTLVHQLRSSTPLADIYPELVTLIQQAELDSKEKQELLDRAKLNDFDELSPLN